MLGGMEDEQVVKRIPCEQTRMVKALIRRSGLNQGTISEESERVSEEYREICSDLPKILSRPTISRMVTGSNLVKMRRCNLVLLHLTVRCAESSMQGAGAASRQAMEEAEAFASAVLAAGVESGARLPSSYDPNDPRHDRTVDLFGGYGISLLEAGVARGEASSLRKLAVLQWLSGNTDDARYWSRRAGEAVAEQPSALDNASAAQEAFAAGRWYLFHQNRAVAETYLELAASTGHADAAFLLGEVLEALERIEEARRWFSIAETNGHSEAGERLAAIDGAA
ncbi:sel1 repeat family protein [Actinomadura bangladeshensis]|uniref:Sel1 repeat family protein n=1 Tax=Actinomadura bangladeshensis TaxID=453573 RepID=A0A4R4PBG0_9ACTN|nr:sel1 repeat family protein [Actinomadura bangladeshensis]TDC19735.1 sel1 repeat family protein [Actinomadura bangladeshensis]